MAVFEERLDRIQNARAVVGVVGLGFVGLPLAVAKAQAGYQVIGLDIDPERVRLINSGTSYIEDVPNEELRKQVESGRLRATTDFAEVGQLDALSVCVPTPIDEHKQPDLSILVAAMKSIAAHARDGLLVILSSTTYPGTTNEIAKPILEAGGLKVGVSAFLAYSPERIDPGNKQFQIKKIPRVVGGVTKSCARLAAMLYQKVLQDRLIEVDCPEIAEMAKIVENTFRLVNIGLMNELAILCHKMGLDIWKVIEAASTKPYGFLPFYPGPGIGGHCIPVDPYYLAWKAKEYHFTTQLIETAGDVNQSMPAFVVYRINAILNDVGKPMRGAKVLVLGAAYKKNVADLRESPVLEILQLLNHYGVSWQYHDPLIPSLNWQGVSAKSQALTKEVVAAQDLILIATDHEQVDYQLIADHAEMIFDTRNVMANLACQGKYAKL